MTAGTRKGLPLHGLMLIGFLVGLLGGLTVNLTIGGDAPWVQWLTSNITGPAGQIFLRLLLRGDGWSSAGIRRRAGSCVLRRHQA